MRSSAGGRGPFAGDVPAGWREPIYLAMRALVSRNPCQKHVYEHHWWLWRGNVCLRVTFLTRLVKLTVRW